MNKIRKPLLMRPVGHVFGQKRAWHDNQPFDLLHVNGRIVGSRRRITNPAGTRWESWAKTLGYGAFDNSGRLISWSPRFLDVGLSDIIAAQ